MFYYLCAFLKHGPNTWSHKNKFYCGNLVWIVIYKRRETDRLGHQRVGTKQFLSHGAVADRSIPPTPVTESCIHLPGPSVQPDSPTSSLRKLFLIISAAILIQQLHRQCSNGSEGLSSVPTPSSSLLTTGSSRVRLLEGEVSYREKHRE